MTLQIIVFIFSILLHNSQSLVPEVAPQASMSNRVLRNSDVLQVTSVNFGKPGKYPAGMDNSIVFTGEGSCVPQILCDKLEIHEKCNLEYLMISDETYSYKVLCGSTPMKKAVRAGNNILKLRFRSSKVPSSKPKTGFRCTVSCLPELCMGDKPVTPEPASTCGGATCAQDATCETKGKNVKQSYCLCKPGFAGNGIMCGPDEDHDGRPDKDLGCEDKSCKQDNCPKIPNSGQEDFDKDGKGDICDDDSDGDKILNGKDNCPMTPNPKQEDKDKDKLGDACDPCPETPRDWCPCVGQICETIDRDHDEIPDAKDNCPLDPNTDQKDTDGDKHGDVCDNCPEEKNPDQMDKDADWVGDKCDDNNDEDRDGTQDSVDNCPKDYNPDQLDTDHDGKGDVCDSDKDNDTILNEKDNCPLVPNKDQIKTNPNIKEGDACAKDADGDNASDMDDVCSERNDITTVNFTNFDNVTLARPENDEKKEVEPVWVVRDNGAEIEEMVNSFPSACFPKAKFGGVDFAGTIYVKRSTDDDYIGFIFSYQNQSNYYAFMWKCLDQGRQRTGQFMQLRLISLRDTVTQEALWYQPGPENPTIKALWTYPDPKSGKTYGWKHETAYRYSLIHRPKIGLIRITMYIPDKPPIDSGNIINNVLKGGKIGILAFSQENTIFSQIKYRCNEKVPRHVHEELSPELQSKIEIDSKAILS